MFRITTASPGVIPRTCAGSTRISAQPMTIAFTFGSARGSEGISVPAADCSPAKSLLRFNIESRVFMLILLEGCCLALCRNRFVKPTAASKPEVIRRVRPRNVNVLRTLNCFDGTPDHFGPHDERKTVDLPQFRPRAAIPAERIRQLKKGRVAVDFRSPRTTI